MGSVYRRDGGKQQAGHEPPQLHGSRVSTQRPASCPASLHVGAIFGALWRPLRRVRRAFALPLPQPRAPGIPTCSPRAPAKSPLHLGQQALMNKRPIRRWGAADEWTFRFQVWHRFASGFLVYRVSPGEAASPSGVTAGVSEFSKLPLPPSYWAGLGK